MKKAVCILLAVLILLSLSACQATEDFISSLVFMGAIMSSDDSVPKEEIIEFVNEHKDELEKCAETGDFSSFEGKGIVKSVSGTKNCAEFFCGGRGLSVSGYYCGFFYSASDNADALEEGDEYYSEKIFDHFYFYEITYY